MAGRHTRESLWVSAARQAVGAVLPVSCGGCARPDRSWCRACQQQVCGPARPVAELARVEPAVSVPSWALTRYAGVTRELIVAWKERRRADLGAPVANGISAAAVALLRAEELAPMNHDDLIIVPVPSSRQAIRARDGDLLADVARQVSARLRAQGVSARTRVALRQPGGLLDQSGLDRAGRAKNVAGRFSCGPGVAGLSVVIVDDIVTTGSTAAEAVRAVSAAGGRVLGVAALAATVREHPAGQPLANPESLLAIRVPTERGED